MARAAKRYVLLLSDGDLGDADVEGLQRVMEDRYGRIKLITVEGNRRALIVKTTNAVAPLIRERTSALRAGRWTLRAVLTSGAVGKLKKSVSGGTLDGQVSE